jgi:hypothetical protein
MLPPQKSRTVGLLETGHTFLLHRQLQYRQVHRTCIQSLEDQILHLQISAGTAMPAARQILASALLGHECDKLHLVNLKSTQ